MNKITEILSERRTRGITALVVVVSILWSSASPAGCFNPVFSHFESGNVDGAIRYLTEIKSDIKVASALPSLIKLWDGHDFGGCVIPSEVLNNRLVRLHIADVLVQARFNEMGRFSVDEMLNLAREAIYSDYFDETVLAMNILFWNEEIDDIKLIIKIMSEHSTVRRIVDNGLVLLGTMCRDEAHHSIGHFLDLNLDIKNDARIQKLLESTQEFREFRCARIAR